MLFLRVLSIRDPSRTLLPDKRGLQSVGPSSLTRLGWFRHAPLWAYGVLVGISTGYPPVAGRFHTCYSPVRRSPAGKASFAPAAPRLACVRPVASVHPEPGSNSPLLLSFSCFFSVYNKTPKKLSTEAPIPFRGSATPKSIAFIPVQRIIVTWTRLHSLA